MDSTTETELRILIGEICRMCHYPISFRNQMTTSGECESCLYGLRQASVKRAKYVRV